MFTAWARRATPIALPSLISMLLIVPLVTFLILSGRTLQPNAAAEAASPGPVLDYAPSGPTPIPSSLPPRQPTNIFTTYLPHIRNALPTATPPAKSPPTPFPTPTALDDRFAIVATTFAGKDAASVLDSMHVRRYYNYYWWEPVPGKDGLQMVARNYISDVGFDDFVRSHSGLYYMIGNEPNVPNQDNLPANAYADTLHTWIQRIKTLDPTARILNGGIVNWPDGPAALAYLATVRQSYLAKYGQYPPIDVWSIHSYPPVHAAADGTLHSYCDTSVPKAFVVDAVSYLRSVGETGPVWLTEFGMDWGNDSDPCFVTFMQDMVRWLKQAHLVDRWYWYSTNSWAYNGNGQGGALMDLQGNLTTLGQTYRDLAGEYPLH